MALNGQGEPAPTMLQAATQYVKIELFTQWQTYQNGVHMDSDTFNSIDFEALAIAALGSAGLTFTGRQVSEYTDSGKGRKPAAYDLSPDAIAKHGEQVQG